MVQNRQKYRLQYWATRSSVRLFACSLAPLTRSLAPDFSHPPLRSLVRSLAHFAHSFAHGKVNYQMAILSEFFSIFDHSGMGKKKFLLLLGRTKRLFIWSMTKRGILPPGISQYSERVSQRRFDLRSSCGRICITAQVPLALFIFLFVCPTSFSNVKNRSPKTTSL